MSFDDEISGCARVNRDAPIFGVGQTVTVKETRHTCIVSGSQNNLYNLVEKDGKTRVQGTFTEEQLEFSPVNARHKFSSGKNMKKKRRRQIRWHCF